MIREPQLLILDDATSAVDPSVEQAILAAAARGELAGRPSSSSPTGWPRSCSPTRSSTSRRGGSSTTAPTTSCSAGASATSGSSRHTPARPPSARRSPPTRSRRRPRARSRRGRGGLPMSMRSQVLVEHHGVATGKEMTTWQTLRRGVELSPELRKGIWVTVAARGAVDARPGARARSSSSASPTTASSPPAAPTLAVVAALHRHRARRRRRDGVLRLLRQRPPLPVVRERSGDVAAQGVPAHPRPRDADPEHRAARVARLARHLRRRHDLDVRAVRRAHAA